MNNYTHFSYVTVYIALGSNLHNPVQQLTTAVDALQQMPHTRLVVVSTFYQTAPVGFTEQPDFINAVACLETLLPATDLLQQLHKIEHDQGRVRSNEKNCPRTLDLDLLLYGQMVMDTPELTLPHPRMHERAFVLIPLLEIAPELRLPTNGKALRTFLKSIS